MSIDTFNTWVREVHRTQYHHWTNSWRGKFWRLCHGVPRWWTNVPRADIKFKDEL
jgi:hypothetical protein